MRPPCKRVAVIGGGIAGLVASKSLIAEGIEPVCFEKSHDIGGLWRYHDEDIEGIPSIMWATVLNNTKEFYFSDIILPKKKSNYFKHDDFYEFIKYYADLHNLRPHCFCNREVIRVERASNYCESGRWDVTVKSTTDENVIKETFDGVLVCVGQFSYPKIVKFPEMEKFSGKIIHTHSLKIVGESFLNKRVVVIGTGCSALDAAVETSTYANQVYLSMRTPCWILPRKTSSSLPTDYVLIRRYIVLLQKLLPLRWASWIVENYVCNRHFDHKIYGIQPKNPFLSRDPILNDILPLKLLTSDIIIKENIKCFTENGVIFENENQETEVDIVIMGTGYNWNSSFLEEGVVQNENGKFNLYKNVYPTHLRYPTLAIIGLLLPIGPGFAPGELQVRWAAHLLAHSKKTLPEEKIMAAVVTERYEENLKRFGLSDKTSVKCDYVPYCDELAKELGVMPNLWKIAFTDPKLFLACVFGPCTPYQYRLSGPGKWEGARDAILTVNERVRTPLSAEYYEQKTKTRARICVFTNLLIPLMLACILMWANSNSKYYTAAIFVAYYLLTSPFASKYLFTLLPLSLFYINWHGIVALYFLFLGIFIYFIFDYTLIKMFA